MLPYLATILVLVLISRNAAWIKANMPASLGKPFSPGGGKAAASDVAWRCARCGVIAQGALRAISAIGFWRGSACRRQLLD